MRRGPPRRGVYVVNRVRGRGGGGQQDTRGELAPAGEELGEGHPRREPQLLPRYRDVAGRDVRPR
jgi:hypothetical protein